MQNFKNKTVVITGGTSGIGLATAKELTAKEANVIITGRNKETVENESKAIGAIGIASDQSDLNQIEALAKHVGAQFEKVDVLFINAGIAAFSPISAITENHFDSIMDINFKGALFTLKEFLPPIK